MNKIWIIILLVFSINCFSEETVRLTSGEWAPYLSENLKDGGYGTSIVTAAFNAVNIDVIYDYYPWKRSFLHAKDGIDLDNNTVNGTILWVETEERKKSFIYTAPVIIDYQLIYSLKSNPVNWETLDDLIGKKIGLTLHAYYPGFANYERKDELIFLRYGGYELLFARLLSGRIDAIPYESNVASYYLRANLSEEARAKIVVCPTKLTEVRFHIIMSKAVPENKRLRDEFNRGLAIIKNNGILKELENKFNQGYFDK